MRVRINLASEAELLELRGVGAEQAKAIIQWRTQHGPIADEDELRRVLSRWPIDDGAWDTVDFAPAEATAPEAPGA